MNIASLELCRELYELSGWDSGHYEQPLKPGGRSSNYPPLYDLGYLLRKLTTSDGSKELNVSVRFVNQKLATDLPEWVGKWIAYHSWMKQTDYPAADTPEAAAAKLCIELLKQGVLKRGEG